MSNQQITWQIEVLKKAAKEATRSKESAIKFLQDAGILKTERHSL